ncbi:hypothetical protein NUACC21_74980 [Scytonema sp. NUACC21]
MKPLVSILIPCYNADPWLAETLQSALAQTWQYKEIIFVDDGSTDRSLAIAKEFENTRIKVICQNNRGASAARNRALQEAQGDFIQYLDADDLLAPDKIECQLQLYQQTKSEYLLSGEWARFYNSPTEAKFIPEPVWNDMSPVDWLVCSWEGGGMMHPAAWLVPRTIVEKAGLWNENLDLNDDGEYFSRVVLASQSVKFCLGAKSYYRSGILGSLSGRTSRESWESGFLALKLCTSQLLAKEDSWRTRHACATAFQRFIYSVYPDALDLVQRAEAEVQFLGGSDLKPLGGRFFQILSRFVGWKFTKRTQKIAQRILSIK